MTSEVKGFHNKKKKVEKWISKNRDFHREKIKNFIL
jgi:hypothetical protein